MGGLDVVVAVVFGASLVTLGCLWSVSLELFVDDTAGKSRLLLAFDGVCRVVAEGGDG